MSHKHQHSRIRKIAKKSRPGSAPGEIIVAQNIPAKVSYISYSHEHFENGRISEFSDIDKIIQKTSTVNWLSCVGLDDAELFTFLSRRYTFHKLALEDTHSSHQRPKVDFYDEHTFIILNPPPVEGSTSHDAISLFLYKNNLVNFIDKQEHFFAPVMERISRRNAPIRVMPVTYLVYAIIDFVVDLYFPCLEYYGQKIDEYENSIITIQEQAPLEMMHKTRSELKELRSRVWAHRELISKLMRQPESSFQDIAAYLKDCYDHTVEQLELIDTYREACSNLIELSYSTATYKLNEIMKVLTIIASIFMPLAFITGIYGMNFHGEASPWNMPELRWYYGYPFALSLMILTIIGFILYLKRKKWI